MKIANTPVQQILQPWGMVQGLLGQVGRAADRRVAGHVQDQIEQQVAPQTWLLRWPFRRPVQQQAGLVVEDTLCK
jgi:hypothetical protein